MACWGSLQAGRSVLQSNFSEICLRNRCNPAGFGLFPSGAGSFQLESPPRASHTPRFFFQLQSLVCFVVLGGPSQNIQIPIYGCLKGRSDHPINRIFFSKDAFPPRVEGNSVSRENKFASKIPEQSTQDMRKLCVCSNYMYY